MKIEKQSDFPLLEEYKKHFPITEETIFPFGDKIYTNYPIPEDIEIHEAVHLKQQEEYGLYNWINKYLSDKEFRLEQEIEAYKAQINSIKDRNNKNTTKILCARALSSELYGNILTYEEAFKILCY